MNRDASLADNWAFFERIYCITLQERPDRRESAEREFANLGIDDRVHYMVVEKHADNPEQGIYQSHLQCMNDALAAGAQNMLIFEDDVVFDRFNSQRFGQSVDFLKRHPDWTLFFLGCLVKRSRPTEIPAVRAVNYSCLAHAYAINRPCALQVVEKPWQSIPFDVMLSRLNGATYAVCPTFAFQSAATTDNDRQWRLDRFRRYCGGLWRIQKANDWFHRNKALVVALHLIGLGLVYLALITLWNR